MISPIGTPTNLLGDHRFELLLGAIGDYAIYMLDPNGFITSWNFGAERIKGYAVEEIIGQHFSKFFTADDQQAKLPEKILERTLASGRHEAEGWRVRKDGKWFWANAIVQTVHDEKGAFIGFAKITRDMTEKMLAQQALAESEERFRLLVDGAIDYAIYMLDASGIVTNWNAGAQRLKGYTAGEIVGQHFSKFYTKEDRAKGLPGIILTTAAQTGRYEAEGWHMRKDGSRFWASAVIDAIKTEDGRLIGFAKITRDITERRAAQETVRESERQFRLLVSNVTDYALYMLDPNGIVTSWNMGAQRIKGYLADEIVGYHFSRFYTEDERAAGLPARALHTALTAGRFEAEGWRVRKDGTTFWANVVIDPVRDERGDLVGFAKITRDITERRQATEELRRAEVRRAHSQKMDALGQLTGGVAHDFNNLLMIVVGQAAKLKKTVKDDEKANQALRTIEAAADRGATLTRQLLTFSRRQAVQPVALELARLFENLKTMLSTFTGSLIDLSVIVPSNTWTIKADANELELAIVNLVINARDSMPTGGTVTVTTENVTVRRNEIESLEPGEFVALRVTDTGTGIAPDVLPKVFDPFFSTKQTDRGTGLGLSQVHGFIHQSNGSVAIDSELGRGTTVTLYLPRVEEAVAAPDLGGQEDLTGSGKVLVVEDNPDVAEVTVYMLRELGYDTVLLDRADDAVERLKREGFDLIVSDVVMPGVRDGIKLAKLIREHYPETPMLLVTGYSDKAGEIGPEFALLRKPFQITDLGRAVARVISTSRQSAKNVVRLRTPRSL